MSSRFFDAQRSAVVAALDAVALDAKRRLGEDHGERARDVLRQEVG